MTDKALIENLKIEKKKWENKVYGVGETRIDMMIEDTIKVLQNKQAELEKKDKIIDLMANEIEAFDGSSYCRKKLDDIDCSYKNCLDCIKKYFKKKVVVKDE